jgi:carboxypeptidase D
MRFSFTCISTLFCASTVIAASSPYGHGVFNKVRSPLIEKRAPDKPFQNSRLQKRASRWLTDKSKGKNAQLHL